MAAGAGFWNILAKNYAKSPVADEVSYQSKLEKTRAYLHPDMDVLEIGCGTGSTALLHAPYVKNYEGVDFSKKMLSFANDKLKKSGLKNLSFTCQPIDDVSRESNSVDIVLAMNILHLLPNHEEVLEQIHKLLKPGGMFISSTACISETRGPVKYLLPIGKMLQLLPPVQMFTFEKLEKMVTDAGFELVDVWHPKSGPTSFIEARKPA